MVYPSHGFESGEDPFGLNYSLRTYGFSDIHAALRAEGLGGNATESQQHLYPQRTIDTRSFRLECRPNELEGLLSTLSATTLCSCRKHGKKLWLPMMHSSSFHYRTGGSNHCGLSCNFICRDEEKDIWGRFCSTKHERVPPTVYSKYSSYSSGCH
jgi:hypothetical protein